jgi:hypothetical protein
MLVCLDDVPHAILSSGSLATSCRLAGVQRWTSTCRSGWRGPSSRTRKSTRRQVPYSGGLERREPALPLLGVAKPPG